MIDNILLRARAHTGAHETIIAWFSCGATSAIATRLALRKYDHVRVIYIETGQEHQDNIRFLHDCEKWFSHPIEVFRSEKYSSVFDVINKTHYINGIAGARCTLELKKKVRYRIEDDMKVWKAQVFGFDAEETKRAQRFSEQYPKAKPIFPLIENGLTKTDCLAILSHAGIELPVMYRLGFHNNNCIGCVKGGKGYWAMIREKFPEYFAKMAQLEREIGHSCIRDCFLDELPMDARKQQPIVPSCSLFCDPEFM